MRTGINPGSEWGIILDILRAISEEEREGEGKAKKTRILQKAYLDRGNFKRYFDFLVEHGFIGYTTELDGEKGYHLTEKGRDLLPQLKEISEILH